MFNKIQVIVNARAGAYTAQRILKNIKNYLEKSRCKISFSLTRYRYHAKILAMESIKNNVDLIISIGGDGTINEIINGMIEFSENNDNLPALGIISAGTGADLCRTLNIPFDYKRAIDIILKGSTMPVDIGRAEFKNHSSKWHRYFINVFDIGLGGNVIRIAKYIPRKLGGFATFLLSSFAGLIVSQPVFLKIYIDDKFIHKGDINIIGAANGKYFGGGMKIAPMASINDGYLEILYVKDTNIFKFIKHILLPVYDANHLLYKNLYHHRAKKLKIIGEKIFPVDIDGEEEKASEVEISIIPGKIKIVVPDDF
ncbi:MAG: diacylglycerol kinase family lipid kinase [candidate division WOR-3 bacterium]|nr:diacylglycerol kinase family lipid kinase [candidate division WOR-3 bacterium]